MSSECVDLCISGYIYVCRIRCFLNRLWTRPLLGAADVALVLGNRGLGEGTLNRWPSPLPVSSPDRHLCLAPSSHRGLQWRSRRCIVAGLFFGHSETLDNPATKHNYIREVNCLTEAFKHFSLKSTRAVGNLGSRFFVILAERFTRPTLIKHQCLQKQFKPSITKSCFQKKT